jgi:hypothetical protein
MAETPGTTPQSDDRQPHSDQGRRLIYWAVIPFLIATFAWAIIWHSPQATARRKVEAIKAMNREIALREQALKEQALKAKAALLVLMRASPSPFEGADPDRFAAVEIRKTIDEGRFTWGAFTIDVEKRTYVAHVESEQAFWEYRGQFVVTPSGEWRAENLETRHATARPK